MFLVNVVAKPPLNPIFNDAPRKSISSIKSSLDIDVVPFPSILPSKLVTPALSPSTIGLLSILRLYETLGSL